MKNTKNTFLNTLFQEGSKKKTHTHTHKKKTLLNTLFAHFIPPADHQKRVFFLRFTCVFLIFISKSKKLEENTKNTLFQIVLLPKSVCFFVFYLCFLIFWFWMLFPKTSKTSKIKKTRGKHPKKHTLLGFTCVFLIFWFLMLFPKTSKTSKIKKKTEENTKKTHTFGEQLVG